MIRSDLYINGQWVATPKRHPVYDPSDNSVITEIAVAGDSEVDAALDAAANAFPTFAKMPARARGEILRKAFEIMIAEADDLARLVSRENGKVFSDAKGEILYAAEFFRWFSEEAVRVNGEFRHAPSGDKRILVTHQPVGVSLLITPWNFPAAMATRKIGPAVAAGCTVIVKPAMETPLTTLAIADILHRAGLPAGVVNVITPTPAGPAVTRLLADPRVKNLSFTGSTQVGKLLLKQAADRVIRTSMELGGNAPFIVLDDANIDDAVAGAMLAKLRNGGAACTAANRFYVSKEVAKEFVDKLTVAMSKIKMASGLTEGAQLGASVSIKERDKIADLVDNSVKQGGKVTLGGAKPAGDGAFYPPTVMTVAADNEILKEEIFGPVLAILTFRTDDEVIEKANNTPYGLSACVWTDKGSRIFNMTRRLRAGVIWANTYNKFDAASPFGGYKESGFGREGGIHGLSAYVKLS